MIVGSRSHVPGPRDFRRLRPQATLAVRLQTLGLIAVLSGACNPTPPQPTATGQPTLPKPSASGRPSPTGATVPVPEDCEDYTFVACPRQVARLSVALAGSAFCA